MASQREAALGARGGFPGTGCQPAHAADHRDGSAGRFPVSGFDRMALADSNITRPRIAVARHGDVVPTRTACVSRRFTLDFCGIRRPNLVSIPVRFGSFFNTYMGVFGEEWKQNNPALPSAFPFDTPFRVGFFGALFTPEKSIFLFDPLLPVLTIILVVFAWKKFRPEEKAYLAAFGALLFGYVCFYAKYTDWSGDTAWGDRYVATAAQLVALIAVPLLLRHRAEVGKLVWRSWDWR